MSSVSVRPSTTTTDVGYGEQEQDANSALLELDKGLRSSKVGEQCEAIVRFPRLFEKYPFPILINSAFLKLADVFRDGTNFLRLCVLKVTQQSNKHLDKILNVDEFVRRIFFVIHSNDPVARAITLRVLGSIAPIISERKNAHHSIHTGLDSHDRVELEAAIYSSSCFAAESRTFAAGICSKLADLIQGLATPAEMKLKLIPIFRHMHQDRQSAALARQVCQEMLPSYPAKEFLTTTLHTLSQLAAASLIDIPDQVNLLLHYLKDPRQVVKSMCLKDLKILAVKAPHMWSAENLCELRIFSEDTESALLITHALDVLCVLSRTPALLTGEKGKVVSEMCGSLCHHWDVSIVARAIQVQTKLACWNPAGEDNKNVETQTQLALSTEAVIVQCLAADLKGRKAAQVLQLALECVKSLSQACPAVVPGFVDTLTMTLTASQGESTLAICQCLASVAEYNPQLLSSHMDSLRQLYNTALGMDYERDSIEGRVLVGLAVLVLLGDKEKHGYSSVSTNVNELVSLHPWPAYRIARQAARLGCHRTAADIFAKLSTQIASEHFYYWLCALHQFCLAETCLTALPDDIPKLVPALSKGLEHYEKGIAQLKAASTPSHPLQFQCEFMRLRADMLHNCLMLLTCTASIRTCPPPAIAPAVAMTTGQELLRCGRLAIEMQNCYSQIQQLSEKYIQLHQASFDADPDTLNKIHMLQQQCLLLAHVVDSLILSNPAYSTNKQPAILESFSAAQGPGHNWARGLMERAVSDILGHLQKVLMETGGQPISHLHMDCLYRTCVTLLRLAFSSPRYFFQALQSTSIKLAMSPTARSSADPVLVATDTHLTSKVEGVIQHGQKPGLFRKVCKVKLSVSSVCTAAAKVPGKLPDVEQVNNKCTWLVEPHHDYFSQQILLSFPVPGYHTVTVDTSVIDEEGYCWKTGPKLTLSVKSHDERAQQREREKQQQQQQQQAAQAARTLTAK